MSKTYPSPLSDADLDTLTELARKGNTLSREARLAPMYCACDGGDASQPDAYLFVCWPAQNPAATRAGLRLFNALGEIAAVELGAIMQASEIEGGRR